MTSRDRILLEIGDGWHLVVRHDICAWILALSLVRAHHQSINNHVSYLTCNCKLFLFIFSTYIGGAEQWDKAVDSANAEYRTRMHNICCDNCHSHVAYALNSMNIRGPYGIHNNWDMVKLCFLLFVRGKFISVRGMLAQFLPFGIIAMIVVLVKTV